MVQFVIDPSVKNISLTKQFPYTTWHEYTRYFLLEAGVEHYKLLAFLSQQCPEGSTVIDIGTHVGYSALAMAYPDHVNVVSYDLYDHFSQKQMKNAYDYPNITFKIANCVNDVETLLKAPLIMLDVDPHDGIQEKEIIELLMKHNYKGVVVCDDILKNQEMKDFWSWVPLKKLDVTQYGHWSGTGIIVFDETVHDVIVN